MFWSGRGRRSFGPVNHSSRPKTRLIRSLQKRNSEKKTDDNSADKGEDISSNDNGKGDLFRSDPQYETSYNAQGQVDVYGAKTAVEPPRPLLELGRQQYTSGAYDESSTLLGKKIRCSRASPSTATGAQRSPITGTTARILPKSRPG